MYKNATLFDMNNTIINVKPDIRVIIYGAIIDDVLSVNYQGNLRDLSTVTINIANPRDRYTITKQDLLGYWRDDKQITKKIYQVKVLSGIVLNERDPIFSAGDPVKIFIKNRYSGEWRFLFSGFIRTPSLQIGYGSSSQITLACEDVLRLFRLGYEDVNPSLSIESRKIFRNKVLNVQEQSQYKSTIAGKVFSEILEYLILGEQANYSDSIDQSLKFADSDKVKELNESIKEVTTIEAEIEEIQKKIKKLVTPKKGKKVSKYNLNLANDLKKKIEDPETGLDTQLRSLNTKISDLRDEIENERNTLINSTYNDSFATIIGGCGYFREIKHLYKDAKNPDAIYNAIERSSREFITSYTLDTKNRIVPLDTIIKEEWDPSFTLNEVEKMATLNNLYNLVIGNGSWKQGNISPDQAIKGEIGGLWNNNLNGRNFCNPRFFLIGYKNLIDGKYVLPDAFRNFSFVSSGEVQSKLSLIRKAVDVIDYNFYALPSGDIMCEPFWDYTNPWQWDIDTLVEKGFSFPKIESAYVGKNYEIDSIPQRIEHPLVVESYETIQYNLGIHPESLFTYIHVTGDNNNNSPVQMNFDPTFLDLSAIGDYVGMASGWYVADGFSKVIDPEILERIQNFEDVKKLVDSKLYTPENDLVKFYGYNEINRNTRLINTAKAAYDYARILFQRFYGDAFKLSITCVYKPEMLPFLGKPIFLRIPKILGIINSISFSFQVGGSPNFTIEVGRLRFQKFKYNDITMPYFGYEYLNMNTDDSSVSKAMVTESEIRNTDILLNPSIGYLTADEIGNPVPSSEGKEMKIKNYIVEFSPLELSLKGDLVSKNGSTAASITASDFVEHFGIFNLTGLAIILKPMNIFSRVNRKERPLSDIERMFLEFNPQFRDPRVDLTKSLRSQMLLFTKNIAKAPNILLPIVKFDEDAMTPENPSALQSYIKENVSSNTSVKTKGGAK